MFADAGSAKAYLKSLSQHPDRPGDTDYMNPDFAIKLANSIQQARGQGLQVGVMSGYRSPGQTGSAYDAGGNSSHTYGLAADVSGLDGANGQVTRQWGQIAAQNGLSNPYGVGHPKEFNHWQLPPQPLERTPVLLNNLKNAAATGDYNKVWAAYSQTPGTQTTGTTTMAGNDNRQAVFDALTSKEIGLSPTQALGVMWSMGGESGGTISSNAVGGGGDYGIAQWTGPRKAGLQAFAQQQGKPMSDPGVQIDYLKSELLGSHNAVLQHLKTVTTPDAAARVWTGEYEIPKVNNSDARIAQGGHVGQIDANGKFIAGDAKPDLGKGGGGTTTPGTSTGGTTTPSTVAPPTPQEMWQMSLGQSLASLGTAMGGGGKAPDPAPDVPIRTMAMETPTPQSAPSPLPPEFAGGVPGDLASMATMPQETSLPQGAPGLTDGAPSMTSMLPGIGTDANFNYLDPRRTVSPSTSFRGVRLG